jgi:hypothetical protein
MGRPRKQPSDATLGFEQKLWQAADALRNNMDAAEYKHVVLGVRAWLLGARSGSLQSARWGRTVTG